MVEEGALARCADDGLPADAVVTVTGKIGGRPVCVMANDMTVKAGTWGRTTIQKIQRIQEIARDAEIPMLYLVDSAGGRLDEQFDIFVARNHSGRIFHNQIQLSGVVPQICVLLGPSPAGSAYIPAFCDLVIMVDGHASAYLGSPRMSEMATGEKVTMEEMGGARMHCSVSGLGDVLAASEEEALRLVTRYLTYMPRSWREAPPAAPPAAPAAGRSIEEIVPAEQNRVFDMYQVIDRLVDEGSFFETKRLFAPELITGLARLDGRVIGVVANQPKAKGGVLFSRLLRQGREVRLALQRVQHSPAVPGRRAGLHDRQPGRAAGDHPPRREASLRRGRGDGAEDLGHRAQGLRRRLHGDVGRLLPARRLHRAATAKLAIMGPEAAINAIHLNTIQSLEGAEREAFIRDRRAEYNERIDIYRIASEFLIDAVVPGRDCARS